MEMIIGGAFQGKSTYAKEHHPDVCWKKGADLEKEELMNAEGVLDFQEYIKKELKADKDVARLAEELWEKNPDIILVSQEEDTALSPWMLLTGNTGRQWEESVRISHQKAKR